MKIKLWPPAVLMLILLGNAAILKLSAFRCFNLHDMGCFIDVGWRMLNGQKPYRDFLYSTGPVHLYMNHFFFSLFGFPQTGLLAHMIVTSSIVIVGTYFVAAKFLPRVFSLYIAFFTAATFYIPTAFPWYDHSAQIWGILALLAIAYQDSLIHTPQVSRLAFFSGLMAGVSFMAKTNIGVAYLVGFFVFWLLQPGKWTALKGYTGGVLISFFCFLLLMPSPSEYIRQTLIYAREQGAERLPGLWDLKNWFPKTYLIWIGLVIINLGPRLNAFRDKVILLFMACAVAFFSLRTSMLGPSNTLLQGPIVMLVMILLFQNYRSMTSRRKQEILVISMTVLIGMTSFLAFRSIRYGINRGKWLYGGYRMGDYALKTPPIKGWMFEKKDGEVLDAMTAYIKQHVPPQETLLILTEYQILYPLTQRQSYPGLPFVYASDMSSDGMLRGIREKILAHPPEWIVAYNKVETYPPLAESPSLGLPPRFFQAYGLSHSWGEVGLYKKVGGTPLF